MTIWEIIALAKAGNGGAKSMLHFKGSVLNESALPETGNDGDTYLVDSADSYFAWDGEGWTDVGQLLSMDDVAALFDQVEDAGDAQVARIVAKGQEVEESIPEDYSELSGDVAELKSAINVLSVESAATMKRLCVDSVNGLQQLAIGIEGEYVKHNGTVGTYPTSCITSPFAVQKGMLICIDVWVDTAMAVATYCNSTGDGDYEIIDSSFWASAGQKQFSFFADRDGYICLSTNKTKPAYYGIVESKAGIVDSRACFYVPGANAQGVTHKIKIYESYIIIPAYSRLFYDNNKTYLNTSPVTVDRIAYGPTGPNNEILVFDTNNKTYRFVNGNAFGGLTAFDKVVATFEWDSNGCSLVPDLVEWKYGHAQDIKTSYIVTPATSSNNYKIKINEDTIVIPPYTRIIYGKNEAYALASSVTVNRVAYGASDANNEVLLFDTVNKTFRFVNGNMSTQPTIDEIIIATFKYGMNGCSIPDYYVDWETEEEKDIIVKNPGARLLLLNASIAVRTEMYQTLANRSNLLNLIHFSDIHGSTKYIQRILDFYNSNSDLIHDIIHTGDGVNNHFEDANPFATVGGNILNVVGNHEYWKTGATWPYPYNATQAEVYEKFIGPFISNWTDVIPAGENKNYYYKDYLTANVRMIVLDCISYDTNQATWFKSILSDALTNKIKVICVTHYPPQPGITPIDCNFTTTETLPGTQADPPVGRQIEFMPTAAYQAVDDFIDDGGDFICWLSGHMHKDAIGKVTGYTNQLLVFVSTGNPSANADVVARNTGTKLADLFNIFTFDGESDVIKVIRIGADYDKFFRHRGTIVINYKTQTIVSSD